MKFHLWNMEQSAADTSLTAALYDAYAAKLHSYISRQVQLACDAEDLLFEVFLAAIERERDLEQMLEDEQRAWLWSVARNKVADVYRRAKRREYVPLEHIAEVLDDTLLPEQVTLRREEYQLLRSHLQQLPPAQQEILYLRFTAYRAQSHPGCQRRLLCVVERQCHLRAQYARWFAALEIRHEDARRLPVLWLRSGLLCRHVVAFRSSKQDHSP